MRIHRLGHIECRKLEVWLPKDAITRARQVGPTLLMGLEREVALEIGIEITDATRMRVVGFAEDERKLLVLIDSDWARPTRR